MDNAVDRGLYGYKLVADGNTEAAPEGNEFRFVIASNGAQWSANQITGDDIPLGDWGSIPVVASEVTASGGPVLAAYAKRVSEDE